ncbi:D-ribose-binding periplasmic protein precursor [mine drainage metagenome]|uniref:D-ribose-binding periplasmic protein n=1 Tax=mine drainage metagenome TaxID=410659 RepID=A0A1J5QAJ3_9ZZZZ
MRVNRSLMAVAIAAASTLVLAACSQGGSVSSAASDQATATASTAAKPAPFNAGPVKIALVQNSGAGDYFQQWTNGATLQANAVGFQMQRYDAQADNAKQATDMETAIGSGVKGIIVDHGNADTMCPLINKAIAAGIPVVVYDTDIRKCAPQAVFTSQNDESLASTVLAQAATDLGSGKPVGYVNVLGIAPLDRRNVIWQQVVKANNWTQKFFVGKFTNAVATDNAQLVDAALKANPGVAGIFAPYDELAKGTISAIYQNNLQSKIKVYGIDISNADIDVMTKPGSPWVATACTDPNAVGAGVVRTMALELAGQLNTKQVGFPGVLVTQKFLTDNAVKNMSDLRAKLPDLNLTSTSAADWIPSITFN